MTDITETRKDFVLEVRISDELRDKIGDLIQTIGSSPYDELEEFIVEMRKGIGLLPSKLLHRVFEFKGWGTDSPAAIYFKNLPTDKNLPNTPADSRRALDKTSFMSEGNMMLIGCLLGYPFGYALEKDGEIIQNLCPIESRRKTASSEGFDYELLLHTDDAFHPRRPDYLMLYCVRPDHENEAATLVSGIQGALEKVGEAKRRILRSPLYLFRAPDSWNNRVPFQNEGRPIVVGHETSPLAMLSFNRGIITPLSSEAEEALESLGNALNESQRLVYLNPGELLVLNNYKAAHGRTTYKSRFDGHDRWLQRVFLLEDLWKEPSDPAFPSRVFH
jgi:L-asparagine oxygenase